MPNQRSNDGATTEIERDIEMSRDRLAETLRSVERRLSPDLLIQRATDLLKATVGQVGSGLFAAARSTNTAGPPRRGAGMAAPWPDGRNWPALPHFRRLPGVCAYQDRAFEWPRYEYAQPGKRSLGAQPDRGRPIGRFGGSRRRRHLVKGAIGRRFDARERYGMGMRLSRQSAKSVQSSRTRWGNQSRRISA